MNSDYVWTQKLSILYCILFSVFISCFRFKVCANTYAHIHVQHWVLHFDKQRATSFLQSYKQIPIVTPLTVTVFCRKKNLLRHWKGCGTALEFSLSQQCEFTLSLCVLTFVYIKARVYACVYVHIWRKKGTLGKGILSLDKQSEAASPMLMSSPACSSLHLYSLSSCN